jgi:Lrp/AsnC family transcriptional regulator for asnA, asnC and gidA
MTVEDSSAPFARVRDLAVSQGAPIALDEIDLALLQVLITDGRISQRQLAVKLGVSAPTVGERMTRLERAGVITGYSAQINLAAVGYGQTVYLSVKAAPGSDLSEIMSRLWAIPEIHEIHVVTGEIDLLARLTVRDYAHLRTILIDSVWQIDGMQGMTTILSIAEMPSKNISMGVLRQMQDGHGRKTAK